MSMEFMPGIEVTADALLAEKTRLGIIAQNISNAYTTRDVDGEAYKRKIAVFESYMTQNAGNGAPLESVRVANIVADATPGPKVYNPNHPHADEKGMVTYPNVQTSQEMVDLITSSHAYEANLAIVRNARQLAQQTLQIGK